MQHVPWNRSGKDEEMTIQELEHYIDLFIFSERDRAILKRRLLDKTKYSDLAKEFNYSDRHMQRIVRKAEAILFKEVNKLQKREHQS